MRARIWVECLGPVSYRLTHTSSRPFSSNYIPLIDAAVHFQCGTTFSPGRTIYGAAQIGTRV